MNTPTFANYINGEWVESGQTFENRNPANTDELVALFSKGTAQDMARAADAAAAALPAWSAMNGPARGNILFKAADLLDRRFDSIAAEMTREEGKTLPEAKGEVRRAINIFRYFAGEGSRMPGMLVPSERDRVHMFAIRKPIGVVGLITPWNFPSAIPAWKLAPALICGNTVVLKPASAAPLSSWRIVEALHEAGIPRGVVNFVAGPGRRTGRGAGRGQAAQGGLVHRLLPDRQLAARRGVQAPAAHSARNGRQESDHCPGRRRFQLRRRERGERRVLFHRPEMHGHQPRHRRGRRSTTSFSTRLIERTQKLKVGDGMQPGIEIGPMVDQAQMDTVLKYIEIGKKEAGAPKTGGNRMTGDGLAKGYFVEPTIFADVEERMTIAQEEIFGPVLAVMRAKNFDDAMRIANNIPFGLSSSIQTTNLSRVFEYVYRMEAGLLTVNLPSAGVEYQLPFGGTKDSSFGPKEQGPAALEFYSDYKTVYLKY